MKRVMYLLIMILITACASPTEIGVPSPFSTGTASSQPALEMSATLPASTEALASATFPVTEDVFTQMGITLPAPACGSLTQPQTEGPYYSPNTPERHILVKVRPEGGEEITSQLYFPNQPVEGLTVQLEDRGDHTVGYFNFVVQR